MCFSSLQFKHTALVYAQAYKAKPDCALATRCCGRDPLKTTPTVIDLRSVCPMESLSSNCISKFAISASEADMPLEKNKQITVYESVTKALL